MNSHTVQAAAAGSAQMQHGLPCLHQQPAALRATFSKNISRGLEKALIRMCTLQRTAWQHPCAVPVAGSRLPGLASFPKAKQAAQLTPGV